MSSRREFLKLAGFASLGSSALLRSLAAHASGMDSAATDREWITVLARGLFPHQRLSDEPYRRIADQVLQQAAGAPGVSRNVENGLARVRGMFPSPERPQPTQAQQIAILKKLEGGPFFSRLRSTAVQVLYRDAEVWKLIGYGGNAIQKGGYLESFNDIDWLPE